MAESVEDQYRKLVLDQLTHIDGETTKLRDSLVRETVALRESLSEVRIEMARVRGDIENVRTRFVLIAVIALVGGFLGSNGLIQKVLMK